ncbi:MAG: MEDS domain-containing protein, partial [Elusimicrobia bacterium]|nr:MEDS domain-containing protein [Elusimicrobiota bacterium]
MEVGGKSVPKGIRDVSHGDHCCLLFSSPEQQARITAPFLAAGLERDERCVFVGDAASVEAVRGGLKDAGVAVDREADRGRLALTSAQDYLDGGRWRTEKMLGFLQTAYDSAMADRFTALRAAGDVSWQVGPDQDYSQVVYYEALLDVFFIGKRMVGMCQYPKNRVPAEVLTGILETHKVAAIDAELCSNSRYVAPQALLEKDPDAREGKRVEWMTAQLLRARRFEAERDALEAQLRHAQKMEALGRLAGGVAHDFNNLLTVILSCSDLLLTDPEAGEGVKADVREIRAAGERAAALTRQLLAFTRRRAADVRVLSLNDVVRDMDRLLRRLLGGGVRLETSLSPELGNVLADAGQLEQVVVNLAVNASDAMRGAGRLTLRTGEVELGDDYAESRPGTKAGPHVFLSVSDD